MQAERESRGTLSVNVRHLHRWYRRGYADARAGRPAALGGLSDGARVAYLTGRADGAVARLRAGVVASSTNR
jgi:hypothetical protein